MVRIIKEGIVPRGTVKCNNCHSELEYGNADLVKEMRASTALYNAGNEFLCHDTYIWCPVCSMRIAAPYLSPNDPKFAKKDDDDT